MKHPKVVLDTNVYIRKLLSPKGSASKLFQLFIEKKIELLTSKRQLEELIRVVLEMNELGKRYIAEDDLIALVAKLHKRARLIPSKRQNKLSPDPDDDWIIGIAIKGNAEFLVTENSKDIYQELFPPQLTLTILNVAQALTRFQSKSRL